MLHIFNLYPAVGLPAVQEAGGPYPIVIPFGKAEGPERVFPPITRSEQTSGFCFSGLLAGHFQPGHVSRGPPMDDNGGQGLAGGNQGEVQVDLALRGVRGAGWQAEGVGDDVGTGQDVPVGYQKAGTDNRTISTIDTDNGRFKRCGHSELPPLSL